ncbi:MAG: fibronectin type III domain-containing protein [Candidatus Woesearchaeota archaeon]
MFKKLFSLFIIQLIIFIPVSFAWSISEVSVNETHNSAEISWNTDAETDGRLYVGTDQNVDDMFFEDLENTEHVHEVGGLTPETQYYFKINSTDGFDSQAVGPQSFTTQSAPDTQAPEISDMGLELPSDIETVIKWETDESADSQVYYGTDEDDLNQNQTSSGYVTSHSVSLPVVNDTKYHYYVKSCDQAGNCDQSSTKFFYSGMDNAPPTVNASLPDKYGQKTITFSGYTDPYAYVELFLNGDMVLQELADEEGEYTFKDVSLEGMNGTVLFRLMAEDQVGLTGEEEYMVDVNLAVPKLKVTIPENTTETMQVNGSVDQYSTIKFKVSNYKDQTPPSKVENLDVDDFGSMAVDLSWDEVEDEDLHEYAVYRNETRIATTKSTSYQDMASSGTTYSYRVRAVDESCNEGAKSEPISVTTLMGSSESEATGINLTCDSYFHEDSMQVEGSFIGNIPLEQGVNYVEITATNDYGNSVTKTGEVHVDTEAPIISDTNIGQLTPSYVRDVKIKGTVSEPSTIYVYLNDDSDPSAKTTADGDFDVTVTLSRDASLSANDSESSGSYRASYPTSWENKVKLVAEDESGFESEPVTGDILYTLCGEGNWFSVEFHDQYPDMLNPRMIIEGVAQIGISADVKWNGGTIYNASISNIQVGQRDLSVSEEEDWDIDWFTPATPMWDKQEDEWYGYLMFNIPAQDPSNGRNWTMLEKEENISKHREGECGVPEVGCVKYPLMLTINFQQDHLNYTQEQRVCLDIQSTIEPRIPPDYLPEDFLESSIEGLNSTIELINEVLEPLKVVDTYTRYTCLTMMVVDFVMIFMEKWSCKFSSVASRIQGGDFKVAMAQMGACEDTACNDDNDDACDACKDCMGRVENRKTFEKAMRRVCDRMFCPSAITFQRFVENSRKLDSDEIMKGDEVMEELAGKSSVPGFDDDSGSLDCAGVDDVNTYLEENVATGVQSDYLGVDGDDECSGLHVPKEECCKQEYLEYWDSACLIMDEFKESACLAAKLTDHPTYAGTEDDNVKCNVIWNSVAGFCEPDGSAKPALVDSGLPIRPECVDNINDIRNDNREVIFAVSQATEENTGAYQVQAGYITKKMDLDISGEVEIGEPIRLSSDMVFMPFKKCDSDFSESFRIEKETTGENDVFEGKYSGFREKLDEVSCKTAPSEQQGAREGEQIEFKCGTDIPQSDSKCQDAGSDGILKCGKELDWEDERCPEPLTYTTLECLDQPITSEKAKEVHKDIQNKLGISDKEYVVDPTSSLLRSFQCVCFPALRSYLSLYRNMMMAIKNCFQTILVTGDGDAGMCRAVISVYVCDMLYELIRCFAEKYSWNSGRGSVDSGFGNVFGALTESVNTVSDRVSGRYGESGIFNAIFGEKKLAHAICMFAFTGTWDLDIAGMAEDDFAMDIESTGMVYPCERRFVSYNQAKDGIAQWNYHVGAGMVAGSDISYRLKLVCSDDRNCNAEDGYARGRCDCNGKGEQSLVIDSGQLKAGETYSYEDWYPEQSSGLRYDSVVLEWEYTNNEDQDVTSDTVCEVSQVGGTPPAFCGFDLGTGKYRCDVNVGSESYAYFSGSPSAEYISGDAFKQNEQMKFNIPITYKEPQEASDECQSMFCSYTKFYHVSLVDGDRELMDSEYEMIQYDGMNSYPYTFGSIDDSVFDYSLDSGFGEGMDAISNNDYSSDALARLKCDGALDTEKSYILYLNKTKGEEEIKYALEQSSTVGNADEVSFDGTTTYSGGRQFSLNNIPSDLDKGPIECNFRSGSPSKDASFVAGSLYQHGGSSTCREGTTKTLDAVFTIHDAQQQGGTWDVDRGSVSTYDQQEQKETITVRYKCGGAATEQEVNCPDPMTMHWGEYDRLDGYTECECGDNTCQKTGAPFCVEGECEDHFQCMKSTEDNLVPIEFKCLCGGNTCDPASHKYCVEDECKSANEFPGNQ